MLYSNAEAASNISRRIHQRCHTGARIVNATVAGWLAMPSAERAHVPAIAAGAEVGIVHGALVGFRAPIEIRAVEPVLIAQLPAGAKAETHEFKRQLVAVRRELDAGQRGFAESRNGKRRAAHAQPADEHGRGRLTPLRLRFQPRESLARAKPKNAVAIAKGGQHCAPRQPVRVSVVPDARRRTRIYAVQAVPGPQIDPAQEVLGDALYQVAGKAVRHGVSDHVRFGRRELVNSGHSLVCSHPQAVFAIGIKRHHPWTFARRYCPEPAVAIPEEAAGVETDPNVTRAILRKRSGEHIAAYGMARRVALENA